MYGNKSVPLMVKEKRIADLECEFIFRYGTFGYGYSHEFEQNETPISEIMKESMFFKRMTLVSITICKYPQLQTIIFQRL